MVGSVTRKLQPTCFLCCTVDKAISEKSRDFTEERVVLMKFEGFGAEFEEKVDEICVLLTNGFEL